MKTTVSIKIKGTKAIAVASTMLAEGNTNTVVSTTKTKWLTRQLEQTVTVIRSLNSLALV